MHIEAEYMHVGTTSDLRITSNPSQFQAVEGNVDTRSAEAKPLYKVDKSVSTRRSFKLEIL